MRIVKQGTKPEETWFRGECKRCGTVVEVQAKETQPASQYNDWYHFVGCPVCEGSITVSELNAISQTAYLRGEY